MIVLKASVPQPNPRSPSGCVGVQSVSQSPGHGPFRAPTVLYLLTLLASLPRVSAGRAPEEAVQGAAGQLQPSGAACGQRLHRHPGGAGPHAAADHRRGEKTVCVYVCVCVCLCIICVCSRVKYVYNVHLNVCEDYFGGVSCAGFVWQNYSIWFSNHTYERLTCGTLTSDISALAFYYY